MALDYGRTVAARRPATSRASAADVAAVGAERVDERRGDDDAVGAGPAIARTWAGRLTPKPTATGTGETALTSRTSLADRRRQRGPGAGDADERDAVEEAAAAGGDGARRPGEVVGATR